MKIMKNNPKLIPVIPNKFVYHSSNPFFRSKIAREGLIPKEKSAAWLSDTNINGEVIFATNSDNKEDWFDSTYDDDTYQIDTSKVITQWFEDPNFSNDKVITLQYNGKIITLPKSDKKNLHIITFNPIPLNAIKLIHKGSGNEK